jgi:hypothetical protein
MTSIAYVTLDVADPTAAHRFYPAKDVGVPADGTGSHRLTIGGDAGAFTDPDGFAWEALLPVPTP